MDNSNNDIQNLKLPKFTIISSNNKKINRGADHPSKRWGHSAILNDKSMIIFGGHHPQRTLSNLYSLDFTTLTWSKIEIVGNPPPARDSHSAILYDNTDMIIFGGNGTSNILNDLWSFNLKDKKWNKITSEGKEPGPVSGHFSLLLNNRYMIIYGGINDKNEINKDIFVYDIDINKWSKYEIEEKYNKYKYGQSHCVIDDIMYLFGGKNINNKEYSSELYTLKFDVKKDSKPNINLSLIKTVNDLRPKERAFHTCVSYKKKLLIIVGGETKDKESLDDIWIYNIKNKEFTQVDLIGNEKIEGRFSHSCLICGEILAIYG